MPHKPTGQEKIIIFTRYPEPGKTKTRLIPAIGQHGAASLQKKMTESAVETIKQLSESRSVAIEIRYTGCDATQISQWLSGNYIYRPQSEGSLGDRLDQAFLEAFNTGNKYVIAIGCDCPDLTPAIVSEALDALRMHDIVVGPALDGGYYLIGMRSHIPQLFKGINWGTDQVLEQTLIAITSSGNSYTLLPTLADVDRPEDLPEQP